MRLNATDRILVLSALGASVCLAWGYLVWQALVMPGMDISGKPWTFADYLMLFIMWAIMMVGMMVPTAVRAVMIYGNVAASAAARGSPSTASGWFALGYVLAWAGFSVFATALQALLDQQGLLNPMMESSSVSLGAALLILAGLYQLSPLKNACLRHCQSPVKFLASHYRPGMPAAIRIGAHHGLYCLGCCWLLMGLLFIGGVMNLVWIAAITVFVLVEKLLPRLALSRLAGVLMILGGIAFIAAAL